MSEKSQTQSPADVREEVRERYAQAAEAVRSGATGCCDAPSAQDATFGASLYGSAADTLPEAAVGASLGCGVPTEHADLREGEVVLDLGAGGGIDALLAARAVGPTGKVYGLDMTEEMLALALENKRRAGADNVEFLRGYIEAIPLPRSTVDVVISNCVINLSTDKTAVLEEIFRVLAPGGRLRVSDIVAANDLTPAERAERGSYVGCIAGALSIAEYEEGLARAGFEQIEVTVTHPVVDRMFSAIISARKPAAGEPAAAPGAPDREELPLVQPGACC